jgi:uncharacterized RDD family membrane protein YckC
MSFRIVDGDAPGLAYHRATRSLALGCAWMAITPALLALSFGIYLLIASFDPGEREAVEQLSIGDRLIGLAVIAGITIALLALTRKFILGKRRLVLFLRHFGSTGSLATVTNAATGTLGMGLGTRLVTLDDRSALESAADPNSLHVTNESELNTALARVRRLSGRLRGPTRLYLDVADPIWQNVVLRMVAETDAVLVDVTTPSPNLLWEIQTVGASVRPRWILVGERDGLSGLAQALRGEPTPATQLGELLDGEEIISYRLGQDITRFQRAMRARLLLVTRSTFRSTQTGPPTSSSPTPAPWPPPTIPYSIEGPPTTWWPGRGASLPSEGPGSLASGRERNLARAVDLGILLMLALAIAGLEVAVRAVTGMAEPEPDAGDWLRSVVGFALIGLFVAYEPISTALIGTTFGKRVLRVRVIDANSHQPPTMGRLALRGATTLLLWLCIVPGVLDLLAATNDPLRQTWHDRAGRTYVVRAERHRFHQ